MDPFFFIFYFPTAQKLKSKAQSLPHVYPSTSVCLSLGLGYLGDTSFSGDNRSFYSLEILNPSCQNVKNFREKIGRTWWGAGYNHVSFYRATMFGFSVLIFTSEDCLMMEMMDGWAQQFRAQRHDNLYCTVKISRQKPYLHVWRSWRVENQRWAHCATRLHNRHFS